MAVTGRRHEPGWDRRRVRSLLERPERVMAHARARYHQPPAHGDHDLNPGWLIPPPLVPAAVLVLVVEHDAGPAILLTRRTDTLRAHPGQISFPGGRLDDDDDGPIACALREAAEEVGLARDGVAILGGLEMYAVRTGYAVVPVVAAAAPPLALSPATGEVAELLELPLSRALDPDSYQICTLEHRGRPRRFYAIEHDGHTVWGATAGILRDLQRVLCGASGA